MSRYRIKKYFQKLKKNQKCFKKNSINLKLKNRTAIVQNSSRINKTCLIYELLKNWPPWKNFPKIVKFSIRWIRVTPENAPTIFIP